ncbi:hypothetical protein GU927_013865 [Rhodobacteraceae bacterium HSP-20]|jgi:4-hydroxybenzoyl-CoA thioesterase|uniref:Thioesterase domain-containing protein n=1 Tax=Paragemmobacter amnigenus TaxID=2852097 RepID=A0ABS6J591_9RHOB|nr:hypothetical protein [Rhodobacter amnigenus]MBU9698933.1 hypothetical protein [Rhodobacter amnigenus]MBV4390160.1 hypothetical protein [Rhodobacter amnigenus]
MEFNRCDPAGIVFYPRYFEMMNSVIENFFREALDYSFVRLGLSSVTFSITAHSGAQQRMTACPILVRLTPEGRSAPWPDSIRPRLADHQEAT